MLIVCSHLDIAGSSGNLPDPTTGASVAAIVKWLMKGAKKKFYVSLIMVFGIFIYVIINIG